jgi:hypothetical protein
MKSNLIRIKTKIDQMKTIIIFRQLYISSFNCDKGHIFNISSSEYHNRIRSSIPLCTICYPIAENRSIKKKIIRIY